MEKLGSLKVRHESFSMKGIISLASSKKRRKETKMDQLYWVPLAIAALIVLYLVLGSFFTVRTAEVAVITRFGKFLRVAEP